MEPRAATIGEPGCLPPRAPFPFKVELSLDNLIAFWADAASGQDPVRAALARVIQDGVRNAPALAGRIDDLSVIEGHRPLIDALMSAVFPAASWEQDFSAALVPFQVRSFYTTPSLARLMLGEDGDLRACLSVDDDTLQNLRLLHAYRHVLRQFYGIELELDYPITMSARDGETGLDRYFKAEIDSTFLTVVASGDLPPLSEASRQRLIAHASDPSLLLELIPADRFVFRGFSVLRAIEVTDQAILSGLERDLIERESIVSSARFHQLQERLQALFRRPELALGLAAIEGEQVFLLHSAFPLEHGCIFADSTHHRRADFRGSIFERACLQGQPLIIQDLPSYPHLGPHEEPFLRAGARSMVVAPLFYQGTLIGTLQPSSPRPGDIGPAQVMKLREVLPLFSMAVKRGMDELETRIQAFIKEKCTAIHPSVEWRFRRAVLRSFEHAGPGGPLDLEPIVFEGVYPLYGAADIRGSSTERNLAIQVDLTTHLRLAQDVLRAAHRTRDLPILDALAWEIERHIEGIALGLRSGDEPGILAFIRERVEPAFGEIASLGADVPSRLEAYRAALDPRFGTVYQRRRAFDESVGMINDAISSYLDQEEERAQAMFPHYFEKQKTDGVDFGIYVGGSLVEDGRFDPLYLRNLRLWQLLLMCGIARRAEALKARLPVPLDTTHLVLAHHAPLAIRFRLEEKRFDVDGAYNMRYQVMKRRIDKATIKGTTERLTQPGRIAIVYGQAQEAAEWRGYIEYAGSRGEVDSRVEDLELDELQGVQGLRALRVSVRLDPAVEDPAQAFRERARG